MDEFFSDYSYYNFVANTEQVFDSSYTQNYVVGGSSLSAFYSDPSVYKVVGGAGLQAFTAYAQHTAIKVSYESLITFDFGKIDIYVWGKSRHGVISERVNAKVLVTQILEN
jgi:hypothetical protein